MAPVAPALTRWRFQVSEEVLVHRLMGGVVFDPPLRGRVYARAFGPVYEYSIIVPGGNGKALFVRDSWLDPANINIEEVPDTPWD